MKEPYVEDFSVLIGIDWADQKHEVCKSKKTQTPNWG